MKKIAHIIVTPLLFGAVAMPVHGNLYSEPPLPQERGPSERNRGAPPPSPDRQASPRGSQGFDNVGLNHPGRFSGERTNQQERSQAEDNRLTEEQVNAFPYARRQALASRVEGATQPYMRLEEKLTHDLPAESADERVTNAREALIETSRKRLTLRESLAALRTSSENDFEEARQDTYNNYQSYTDAVEQAQEKVSAVALRDSTERASRASGQRTEESSAAVRAIRAYNYQERNRMVAYVESQIATLEPRVTAMKGKVVDLEEADRTTLERQLEVIESRRTKLNEVLADAQTNLSINRFSTVRDELANTFSAYNQAITLADTP